jgi:probable rRNA maturation factor
MSVTIINRQRAIAVDLASLQEFASSALTECLKLRRASNPLSTLSEVNVVLVSDRRIAEIHRRFMNAPEPTDVITFQHGEVFISTETATHQALEFRTSFERELRLYLVHGLLHLAGFDDKTPAGAAEMKRLQERIVTSASLP